MRYLIIVVMLLTSVNAYGVTLNKEKFDNLNLIDRELKDQFPAYKGLNGSEYNMNVVGIGDTEAQQAIDGMNITQLKNKDPRRKAVKKLRNKLKFIGLDADDFKLMGLNNDIED